MMNWRATRQIAAMVVSVFGCFCFCAGNVLAQDLLDEVAEAYGGVGALGEIRQIEFDSAGYFIGRYQSRTTHEPYDRLPIRTFVALDYETERGVWDNISTWPGELNMGSRSIVNGEESFELNTIMRLYSEGGMRSFAQMRSDVAIWLPTMLVVRMLDNRDRVTVGEPKAFRNIVYDTLVYADTYTVYVHPKTRLIYAVENEAGAMADHTIDEDERVLLMRVYDAYVKTAGVWFPTRYNQYVNGVATADRGIYHLAVNRPVEQYLAVPGGFETANTSGYGGEGWDIAVREAGPGLYVSGNGETHVLYVEMDEYFIVLEPGDFPAHAERTYNAMQPYLKGKPVKYIVPLHHHDDHAWAVHFYARKGATILTTPDKEGFLRKLLARTWGEHGPIENAKFEYMDGRRLRFDDRFNTFEIFAWPDAPHSENMVIGYHPESQSIFTGDFYLGWGSPEGGGVRQGANYGTRALDRWINERQEAREMGDVENYITVHGRPYSRKEMEEMLSIERTIIALPENEAWPTATWPGRYGLQDDTAQNPRRSKMFLGD